MPNPASRSPSEALLTGVMQQVVHLDLLHLEQLYVHLGELIEQLTPPPVPNTSASSAVMPLSSDVLAQIRLQYGERYLEWKQIRQGSKVYGPYPYWRFLRDGKRHSIYLKDLAQALREVTLLEEIVRLGATRSRPDYAPSPSPEVLRPCDCDWRLRPASHPAHNVSDFQCPNALGSSAKGLLRLLAGSINW